MLVHDNSCAALWIAPELTNTQCGPSARSSKEAKRNKHPNVPGAATACSTEYSQNAGIYKAPLPPVLIHDPNAQDDPYDGASLDFVSVEGSSQH